MRSPRTGPTSLDVGATENVTASLNSETLFLFLLGD